jgi:hypothetical protein
MMSRKQKKYIEIIEIFNAHPRQWLSDEFVAQRRADPYDQDVKRTQAIISELFQNGYVRRKKNPKRTTTSRGLFLYMVPSPLDTSRIYLNGKIRTTARRVSGTGDLFR